MDAFAVVSAKPEYGAIINQINEVIEAKRTLLFARTTRAANDRKDNESKS
ncbi:hypothetical protein [Alistipes sp. ZOR0009]|nr:hypothetical protein [Alistipes sp. ZOR0009]